MIGNKPGTEATGMLATAFGRRALHAALKAYRKERWSACK